MPINRTVSSKWHQRVSTYTISISFLKICTKHFTERKSLAVHLLLVIHHIMGFKSITGSSLLKPEDPFPIYLHYENAGYLFNDSEHTWLWEKVNRVIKDPFWMFWIKHFEACTYKGTYINTLSTFFEGRPCLLGKFPYFCHYAPEHPIFPNTKIILNPVQLNKKWNFASA